MSQQIPVQHWTQVQEAGVLFGVKLLFWIYRIFGRPLLYLLLGPVIFYFFIFRSHSRQASLDYLWRLHRFAPESLTRPTLWMSLRHFFNFATCLVDKIAAWSGQINSDKISVSGHQELKQLLNEGQGGVLIISHLGNMEVCRALAEKNPKLHLNILIDTQNAQNFNQLAKKLDPNGNISLLQVGEFNPATAMMLNSKVMAGEFIAVAGDRTPRDSTNQGGNSTLVEFLGEPALFPEGVHLLAGMLRCPLYMIFSLKQQRHFNIYFELLEATPKLPRKMRKEMLNVMAQRYAQRLEYYCKLAPLQWFNFYQFWQNPKQPNDQHEK